MALAAEQLVDRLPQLAAAQVPEGGLDAGHDGQAEPGPRPVATGVEEPGGEGGHVVDGLAEEDRLVEVDDRRDGFGDEVAGVGLAEAGQLGVGQDLDEGRAAAGPAEVRVVRAGPRQQDRPNVHDAHAGSFPPVAADYTGNRLEASLYAGSVSGGDTTMTDATTDDRRVAIVTGAAGALGSAMCERFVRDGIRVVVADVAHRAGARPRRAARPVRAPRRSPVAVDVADYATVEAMVAGRPRLGRPDRHHGQQRGHRRGDRPDLGDAARRLAAHHRHRPDRRLPWLPGRPADHARPRLGPDHQHLLDRRQGRQAQPGRVRGGQGRRHRPDQVGRVRGRAARDPGQRDHAGHDRERELGEGQPGGPGGGHGSATRSGASASRPRSRRWSPSCHPTSARSRPAPCSTSRAGAPATDATCERRSSGSRSPTRRPRRPGRVPSGRRSCCRRRRSRR